MPRVARFGPAAHARWAALPAALREALEEHVEWHRYLAPYIDGRVPLVPCLEDLDRHIIAAHERVEVEWLGDVADVEGWTRALLAR